MKNKERKDNSMSGRVLLGDTYELQIQHRVTLSYALEFYKRLGLMSVLCHRPQRASFSEIPHSKI